MQTLELDAAVISARHHVYWLTGHEAFWLHEAAVVLRADGHCTLISGNAPNPAAAADRHLSFEASWFSTQRQEQPAAVAAAVKEAMGPARRVGFDASAVGSQLRADDSANWVPIDDTLHQLRRRKEPDELALMRKAIACTEAMYARARQIIEPGVEELTVFTELHAAAVRAAGGPLSPMHLGNDFACGAGGGAPRAGRPAAAGELYILDLGPAVHGYFADNARVIAVDRQPTDAQLHAWNTIVGVFPIIEAAARPGVRCRDLFHAGSEHLRAATGNPLGHHLGHGVGLQPHEFPHINPRWDDVLEIGEVFTIEPGIYGPELRGGIRLENQYLVTANGVENLTPFDLRLT
jgi:Xaa-Pro aminopeptidase